MNLGIFWEINLNLATVVDLNKCHKQITNVILHISILSWERIFWSLIHSNKIKNVYSWVLIYIFYSIVCQKKCPFFTELLERTYSMTLTIILDTMNHELLLKNNGIDAELADFIEEVYRALRTYKVHTYVCSQRKDRILD